MTDLGGKTNWFRRLQRENCFKGGFMRCSHDCPAWIGGIEAEFDWRAVLEGWSLVHTSLILPIEFMNCNVRAQTQDLWAEKWVYTKNPVKQYQAYKWQCHLLRFAPHVHLPCGHHQLQSNHFRKSEKEMCKCVFLDVVFLTTFVSVQVPAQNIRPCLTPGCRHLPPTKWCELIWCW